MGLKFNLVQKVNPHDRDAEKKWYAVPSSDSPLSAKALAKAATANTSTAPIEMEAAMEHLANYSSAIVAGAYGESVRLRHIQSDIQEFGCQSSVGVQCFDHDQGTQNPLYA